MKLKSFSCYLGLLIIFTFSPLISEEKIDIWKNKKKPITETSNLEDKEGTKNLNLNTSQTIQSPAKIKIQKSSSIQDDEQKIFGIYDPANYDFSLNMWSTTKAEDLRSSLKRLNKIELSKSSKEILQIILFSFSYPPPGLSEKEFVDMKINWLIKNNRVETIENF